MRRACPRRRPPPTFNSNHRRRIGAISKGLDVQQFGKTTAASFESAAICAERALELEAEIATLTIRHAIPLDVLLTTAAKLRGSVSRHAVALCARRA